MALTLLQKSIEKDLEIYLAEDGLTQNPYYVQALPSDVVECKLQFGPGPGGSGDLLIAGLPYFSGVFHLLTPTFSSLETMVPLVKKFEGKVWEKGSVSFSLPFNVAITGERLALNLLQRATSIATWAKKFVHKAQKYGIAILDTRKTTPGLRALEKYAVRMGGGQNHRFGQTDVWMIKDNHKVFFGGIEKALYFFRSLGAFYHPIIVEIHSLEEFKQAIDLNVAHVLLDNFTPTQVRRAISLKSSSSASASATPMTIEVSGGIRLDSLDDYLMEGVDALSIGPLTYGVPPVDVSLDIKRPRSFPHRECKEPSSPNQRVVFGPPNSSP